MNTKQLNRLLNFCVERTEKGDDTFLSYAGHVGKVDVFGDIGRRGDKKDFDFYYHALWLPLTAEKVDQIIAEISALKPEEVKAAQEREDAEYEHPSETQGTPFDNLTL
jgi:hypothetical protein